VHAANHGAHGRPRRLDHRGDLRCRLHLARERAEADDVGVGRQHARHRRLEREPLELGVDDLDVVRLVLPEVACQVGQAHPSEAGRVVLRFQDAERRRIDEDDFEPGHSVVEKSVAAEYRPSSPEDTTTSADPAAVFRARGTLSGFDDGPRFPPGECSLTTCG
jgi:hypothetical protein